MPWKPITATGLRALLARELEDCSVEEREYFDRVRIPPVKWRLAPWGDGGGGFWAVAIHGRRVLWYNDIEEGFNVSPFDVEGSIPESEYWCNQDTLRWALPLLRGQSGTRLGAPRSPTSLPSRRFCPPTSVRGDLGELRRRERVEIIGSPDDDAVARKVRDDWPFDQPPNTAVITLRSIAFGGAPILHVCHEADDHGWQFLGLDTPILEDACVVGLGEIVRLDPSVLDVAAMAPGWHAWRESKTSRWQTSQYEDDRE